MRTHLLDRLKHLRTYLSVRSDYEWLEVVNIMILGFCSVIILNPQTKTFTATSNAYQFLSMFISEEFFGTLFLFGFLVTTYGLVTGNLRYRAFASGFSTVLWSLLFFVFFNTQQGAIIAGICLAAMFLSFVVMVRTIRDIRDKIPTWTQQL